VQSKGNDGRGQGGIGIWGEFFLRRNCKKVFFLSIYIHVVSLFLGLSAAVPFFYYTLSLLLQSLQAHHLLFLSKGLIFFFLFPFLFPCSLDHSPLLGLFLEFTFHGAVWLFRS